MLQKPTGKIICFGSLIMDISVCCNKLPAIGETVYTYEDYTISPGGKGGNQAVAAARSGAEVTLIGRISNDDYGRQLIAGFQQDHIDTDRLIVDKGSKTGVAFVWVDQQGNNSCLCSLGVNRKITTEDLQLFASLFQKGSIIMTTLEHSEEILNEITCLAQKNGCILIVDPSSKDYSKLTPNIAQRIDILKPNEVETEILTGIKVKSKADAIEAIQVLRDMGIQIPIISLGSQGAICQYDGEIIAMEGIPVAAVDTTAAGDTFLGAMAAKLSQGYSFRDSLSYANCAAAYCVQHYGAQISIPFEENVI